MRTSTSQRGSRSDCRRISRRSRRSSRAPFASSPTGRRGACSSGRARSCWVRSLSGTHAQLLRLLDDELTTVQTQDGYLVLNLRPLVIQLGDQVAVVGRLRNGCPRRGSGPGDGGRSAGDAQDLASCCARLGLPLLALALGAVAIWLAAGRRRVIVRLLAWGFVLGGVLVLVIRGVSGSYVVDELATTESSRPAVENAWEIRTPSVRRRLVADHHRQRRRPRRAVHRRRTPRD